jgi:hypothetical protein
MLVEKDKESESVKSTLASVTAEKEVLVLKFTEQTGVIQRLESSAKVSKKTLTLLQNQIDAISRDHDFELKTLNQEHNNELVSVQSEILSLRNQMEATKKEHAVAAERLKEEHLAEVKSLHEGHEGVVSEVRSEVDALRARIKELNTSIMELETEASSAANNQMEELKNVHASELEALKAAHSYSMAKVLSEKENLHNELAAKKDALRAIAKTWAMLELAQSEKASTKEALASVITEKDDFVLKCTKRTEVAHQEHIMSKLPPSFPPRPPPGFTPLLCSHWSQTSYTSPSHYLPAKKEEIPSTPPFFTVPSPVWPPEPANLNNENNEGDNKVFLSTDATTSAKAKSEVHRTQEQQVVIGQKHALDDCAVGPPPTSSLSSQMDTAKSQLGPTNN